MRQEEQKRGERQRKEQIKTVEKQKILQVRLFSFYNEFNEIYNLLSYA